MKTEERVEATNNARAYLSTLPDVLRFALIGSAAYLPAEQCADVDYAVLIVGDPETWANQLPGFQRCSQYDKDIGEDTFWTAVRSGVVNLMVTNDPAWFERYLVAMRVCELLNLTEKKDRIGVCRIVRDGKSVLEVRATLAASQI